GCPTNMVDHPSVARFWENSPLAEYGPVRNSKEFPNIAQLCHSQYSGPIKTTPEYSAAFPSFASARPSEYNSTRATDTAPTGHASYLVRVAIMIGMAAATRRAVVCFRDHRYSINTAVARTAMNSDSVMGVACM